MKCVLNIKILRDTATIILEFKILSFYEFEIQIWLRTFRNMVVGFLSPNKSDVRYCRSETTSMYQVYRLRVVTHIHGFLINIFSKIAEVLPYQQNPIFT